jgi:hypothetical protein
MTMRWRIILPIVGLIVFTGISYHSYRVGREGNAAGGRFYVWSTIRLDSDPLNRHSTPPCVPSEAPCVYWDVSDVGLWHSPGTLEKIFGFSALPAFFIGLFVTYGLGRFGISEVLSYMVTMPLLIFAWFYFVGWLVDRWRSKRSQPSADKS